jgi:hypothetical protein
MDVGLLVLRVVVGGERSDHAGGERDQCPVQPGQVD